MQPFLFTQTSKRKLRLDPDFHPIILNNIEFETAVRNSANPVTILISIERPKEQFSTIRCKIFHEEENQEEANFIYLERLIKTLIWLKGGFRIYFGGNTRMGEFIQKAYAPGGLREFDAHFMARVYEHPFEVLNLPLEEVPGNFETSYPVGRHLDGYRIGFDAGGSDRKVSAVVNGESIYSEEVVWSPKIEADPTYHYEGIMDSITRAASKLPRVDAIGVSSAGIYIDNRVAVASLFRKVPEERFDLEVRDIFLRVQKEFNNVPLVVVNDGDVTALAGAMSLESNNVLGIAMGTSEAAGYVDGVGNITGWLNELSFVPVDYNPKAMKDEWSGDFGVGVHYFSQDAVIKLAKNAGIPLNEEDSPAEKLKVVQKLCQEENQDAYEIFRTIGTYLGYELAYYSKFYEIDYVLILGRVTSGIGGELLLEEAKRVLAEEFPTLSKTLQMTLPDEKSRRVGQSIAAASLPEIK